MAQEASEVDIDVRLPTEAQLAEEFNVSRQTIRRAMQDLVTEGLVYRVRGRGTFPVAKRGHYLRQIGSVEDLLALSVDTVMEVLSPPSLRIDADAAARLGSTSDRVVTMSFRRLAQGVPFCHTTVHLRPEIAHLVADHPDLQDAGNTTKATIIGLIEDRLEGNRIVEAEQSISVAKMPAEAAEALAYEADGPAMRIDRTYRGLRQESFEVAISFFRPDYYSYRVTLQRRGNT